MLHLEAVAAAQHVDGQQARGVRDLFGEVDRKMAEGAGEAFRKLAIRGDRRVARRRVAALEYEFELAFVVVGDSARHRSPFTVIRYRFAYLEPTKRVIP